MVGESISHYRIVGKLGAGGMGVVYRAYDENLGREVAVKVLHREVMHDPDRLSLFESEARAVAKLAHPNILAIHDFGRAGEVAFAVTELLEGETLGQRLMRERLQWSKALAIGAAIADGLAAAHAKGITHRDIKPGNIFLTSDGRVKILDFGLARMALPPMRDSMAATTNLPCSNGQVVGTVGYMSPEQLRGEIVDHRSDIFTLGCVLYEMLTSRRAFDRGSFALTVTAVLMDPAPDLDVSGIEPSLELNRILGRCLEKNPGERFQSASDLAFALRSVLTEKHRIPVLESVPRPAAAIQHPPRAHERPPAKAVRPTRLAAAAAVTALLVCCLAVAVWLWMGNKNEMTLAVLPFETVAADKTGLGEHLAERLNQSISELEIIRVKPLPSRQALQGVEHDFQAVAARLGVAALLRGRYSQVDDDLKIYIELIDGRDGNVISTYPFSEKLSRVMEDVAEMARSVVEKLGPRLGSEERDRLDCLILYGKARDELGQRNRNTLKIAIGHFQEALKKNPKYAMAYVGLADTYSMQAVYGLEDPRKVFPLGKQAAEEALKIDAALAQAHASLAFIRERFELDRQGAQREYELAIRLGSSRGNAQSAILHRYGMYFVGLGQTRQAVEYIERAKAKDPFSQIMMADLAMPYLYSGDLATAIRICDETISRFPAFAPGYRYRGLAYERRGDSSKAIADLETAVNLSGHSPGIKGELGHVLATAGDRDRAMSILTELQELRKTGYTSCFRIAQIYASLGDGDSALNYLEKAYEEKDPFLWYLWVDPILRKNLADEPRFTQLKYRVSRHR